MAYAYQVSETVSVSPSERGHIGRGYTNEHRRRQGSALDRVEAPPRPGCSLGVSSDFRLKPNRVTSDSGSPFDVGVTLPVGVTGNVTAAAHNIGQHNISFCGLRCGVVDLHEKRLTVCSGWSRRLPNGRVQLGFNVSTIDNTVNAAHSWLGY